MLSNCWPLQDGSHTGVAAHPGGARFFSCRRWAHQRERMRCGAQAGDLGDVGLLVPCSSTRQDTSRRQFAYAYARVLPTHNVEGVPETLRRAVQPSIDFAVRSFQLPSTRSQFMCAPPVDDFYGLRLNAVTQLKTHSFIQLTFFKS